MKIWYPKVLESTLSLRFYQKYDYLQMHISLAQDLWGAVIKACLDVWVQKNVHWLIIAIISFCWLSFWLSFGFAKNGLFAL